MVSPRIGIGRFILNWGIAMRSVLIIVAILFMSGCARLDTVKRGLDVREKGVLIDIKQRAIISSGSDNADNPPIVCAEPSPDAMTAFAAELAAEGTTPQGISAELRAAIQNSATFVGLRTQSIQLLRDGMYRLCEAAMNHNITTFDYALQLRNYQRLMTTLLAVEQLTGAIRVPPITISTEGFVAGAERAAEIETEISKKEAEIERLKNANAADPKIATLTADVDELRAKKEAVDRALGGKATAAVAAVPEGQRSDEHIQAVAEKVADIVNSVNNSPATQLMDLCVVYFTEDLFNSSAGDNVGAIIDDYDNARSLFDKAVEKHKYSEDEKNLLRKQFQDSYQNSYQSKINNLNTRSTDLSELCDATNIHKLLELEKNLQDQRLRVNAG